MEGTISLLDIGNRQAAMRKMFVHKKFRGRETGTAGELLNTLFEWAAGKQIKEIYLGITPQFLTAHSFYKKTALTRSKKKICLRPFP